MFVAKNLMLGLMLPPGTFVPFTEENVARTSQPTPGSAPSMAGAWVTLLGGGGAGGVGSAAGGSHTGGSGGGGGARVSRFFVPAASFGSTYSTTIGAGGSSAQANGGNSVFSTGSVTLTAGGGSGGLNSSTSNISGGAGGSASASGVSGVSLANGTAGGGSNTNGTATAGVSDTSDNVGCGGGGGCGYNNTSGAGGSSNFVTAGAGVGNGVTGSSPSSAGSGNGGAGGGGGGGQNSSGSAGTGGAGGAYGGGGGGGGTNSSSSGTAGSFGVGANGYTKVEFVSTAPTYAKPTVGTPNFATSSTSVTLPTHTVGNLILAYMNRTSGSGLPTAPSAGGTVPQWNAVDTINVTNGIVQVYCAIATATNHTSGTWTNASNMMAVVVAGIDTNALFGAHVIASANSTTNLTPATTALSLMRTDGKSLVLKFFSQRSVSAWGSAPSGYTQLGTNATALMCLDSSNSTTSDAATSQACTVSSNNLGVTHALEILPGYT